MISRTAVLSEVGCRPKNQDRASVLSTNISAVATEVLAVADGMGGLHAGDQAAEIAIELVSQYCRDVFPNVGPDYASVCSAVRALYTAVNSAVRLRAALLGATGDMGTTLVIIVAWGSLYLVANVGDSRSYYVSPEIGMQVTEDHSRVQELVRLGAMTPENAKRSPFRSQLTRFLGQQESIDVDLFPAGPQPGVLDPPCALLLCTDGLSGHLSPEDIAAGLKAPGVLAARLQSLVSLALERGATDNITVAVLERDVLSSANTRVGPAPFGVSSRGEI